MISYLKMAINFAIRGKWKACADNGRDGPHPLVDIAQLFADTRAAGLAVAVLTADDRDSTERFLAEVGVQPDAMVCGNDGRGAKPSADPLLAIASDLSVPPSSLVMVGDSSHDVPRIAKYSAIFQFKSIIFQ